MVRTPSAERRNRHLDCACTLMAQTETVVIDFTEQLALYSDLANLLALPKGARRFFEWHLCKLEDRVSLILDDLPYPNGWKKGEGPFEELHRGMRIALNAVGKMTADEAATLREVMEARLSEKDAIEICAGIAAALVGRSLAHSGAHDWRLVAVIRDMRTWSECFGASMPKDHRSQKKLLALLRRLMPHVVRGDVPPDTIKSIWKPRPRKRGRKFK